MAKKNAALEYRCASCGYTQTRWLGRCPECGEWNTFEEFSPAHSQTPYSALIHGSAQKSVPHPLSDLKTGENIRIFTGIEEFDRVLGGGAMTGSAVLIGGEPGVGKSTLLLEAACSVGKHGKSVLYVSGEEGAAQIKERAVRLKSDSKNVSVLCTIYIEDIMEALESMKPSFVVIDSIQTVYSSQAGIIMGSVSQLKFTANALISWVKRSQSVLIMSAHVTKEGAISGPKTVEHMVDTVLSFERNTNDVRFLHAEKNRFGSVDEIGIFIMSRDGLQAVTSPATMFLSERSDEKMVGTCCTAVYEGSRVFMVEIQALAAQAKVGVTRVYSDKIESARVSRIAAILEKSVGIKFFEKDIYVNVAGGIKLKESAIECALAVALYSAASGVAVPCSVAVIGELTLQGEMRSVVRLSGRAKTAMSLGFTKIYAREKEENTIAVKNIKELIRAVFS